MSSTKHIRPAWATTIFILIMIVFCSLVGRLVYINVTMGEMLRSRGYKQQTGKRPILGRRGTVYDRRGRVLAGSSLTRSLYADPAIIDSKQRVASLVASLTDMSVRSAYDELCEDPDRRFVWLERDLSETTVQTFRQIDRTTRYGLALMKEPKRVYPSGRLAGHLLGTCSIDDRGLAGLELYYDKTLSAGKGSEKYVRDVNGNRIWQVEGGYTPAEDGNSVITTIDAVVQEFTEDVLNSTCEKHKAKAGCAVVMDPKNGDILASASWPTVDPNDFGDYPASARRNRVLTDPFEPGSIFKPFIASAAIEYDVVKPDEKIFCHNGAYDTGSRVLHDYHAYDYLSFAEIVIKSSNIGMGIIGQRLGNRRLYTTVRRFGFGEETGVDLPGEDDGIVRPLEKWDEFTTTSIPMGHEIAATPLQLISAFAALANEGVRVRPRVLRGIIGPGGKVIEDNTKVEPIGRAVPRHAAVRMVREILAGVVEEGTGTRAQIPGYRVFGKTGTAQVPRRGGGGYKPRAYVASFLGGLPADNPELVVFVTVREPDPSIGHFGGTVAAPAVKSILEKAVRYFGIQPVNVEESSEQVPVVAG